MIKDALQKKGVPMLIFDGDCVDARNYSEGQARTRLEGFIVCGDRDYERK